MRGAIRSEPEQSAVKRTCRVESGALRSHSIVCAQHSEAKVTSTALLHTYLVDEQATTTCDHRDLARDARARKRLNCSVSACTRYNMVHHGTTWYNHGTVMVQPWYITVQHGTTMVRSWYNHGATRYNTVQPWYNMPMVHSTAHGPEGLGTYRSIIWPFRYGPVQRSCGAPRALLHIRLGTSLALQRSA